MNTIFTLLKKNVAALVQRTSTRSKRLTLLTLGLCLTASPLAAQEALTCSVGVATTYSTAPYNGGYDYAGNHIAITFSVNSTVMPSGYELRYTFSTTDADPLVPAAPYTPTGDDAEPSTATPC